MSIAAVADDDSEGLKRASEKLRTKAAYADWAKMLREEKPDIVVIGPRWADCHLDMTLAAAEIGASVIMDKPMARTPAECDRMIEACENKGVKIVVAHNMRACPILDEVERQVKAGVIGDLQEMRGRGKEDRRAGGEDLMVLGTHTFDLLRRFGGNPEWAFGRVTVDGRPITRKDVRRDPPEGLDLIAGDTIEGMFAFPGGLTGYFGSKKSSDTSGKRWGIDLYGSKGIIAVRASHTPAVLYTESDSWAGSAWKPLPMPERIEPRNVLEAVHHLFHDLVDAIEKDKEPQASGRNARWAVEMAMSMYESQLTGGPVTFRLKKRENPLAG